MSISLGPRCSRSSIHQPRACVAASSASERRQVTLELPRFDLRVVLAPLVALEPEELVGDRAEALADHLILLEVAEGFGEALGERPNAAAGHGLEVGRVE